MFSCSHVCLLSPILLQAEEDGVACVEMLAGHSGHVNYNTVPSIVYTWPEVASVGKTEEQVKAAGISYKVRCRTAFPDCAGCIVAPPFWLAFCVHLA